MKHLKQLLTVLSLGLTSIVGNNAVQAGSYINVQAGTTNSHAINGWIANDKKSVPTVRLSAGMKGAISDQLKVGLELGTQGYARRSQSFGPARATSSRWSLDGLGVADVYFSKRFDVIAKAGLAYVNAKNRLDLQNVGVNLGQDIKNSSYVVPKAALGLGFNVTENINLNVFVNHEFSKNSNSSGLTSLLGGVQFQFS
jgi:opacity protein-like surface antigen